MEKTKMVVELKEIGLGKYVLSAKFKFGEEFDSSDYTGSYIKAMQEWAYENGYKSITSRLITLEFKGLTKTLTGKQWAKIRDGYTTKKGLVRHGLKDLKNTEIIFVKYAQEPLNVSKQIFAAYNAQR